MKIRGTALHIAEKYGQLGRDAQSSGDRVAAENYFQHAEHYYRIVAAAQAQLPQSQPMTRNDGGGEEDRDSRGNGAGGDQQPGQADGPSVFDPSDPQPYVNGGDGERPGGERGDAPANREAGGGRERGELRRRRPYRERQGGDGGEPRRAEATTADEPSQNDD